MMFFHSDGKTCVEKCCQTHEEEKVIEWKSDDDREELKTDLFMDERPLFKFTIFTVCGRKRQNRL